MATRVPTSWLLNGGNAWLGPRGFTPTNIAAGAVLRLAVRPGMAGALDAPDGSLGGLVAPRGAALDDAGNAYLLGPAGGPPWIKRLGFAATRFHRLLALGTVPGTDDSGADLRQFADPGNLAVSGPFLYVADTGNRRVQVFTTDSLSLRFVWGPRDGKGNDVGPDDPDAWQPADVTSSGGRAYVLDRKYGRVFVHRPGDDALALLVDSRQPDRWDRAAVDRNGRVYLFALGPRAIVGSYLYVADAADRRVLVFSLDDLSLRFIWGPWDGQGNDVTVGDPTAWQPVDVTAGSGRAYFLDRKYGRVYVHCPGDAAPAPALDTGQADHWGRVVVSGDGQIGLYADLPKTFEVAEFDPTGSSISDPPPVTPGETGRFSDRFIPPPITNDDHGRFTIAGHPGLLFDRTGEPTNRVPGESPGPPTLEAAGTWIAGPLDSHLDRCAWDTIALGLDSLPPGSTASVATFTADSALAPSVVSALPDDLWSQSLTVTGMPPAPRRKPLDLSRPLVGLVQSTEGRFLWVKVTLGGDGYATPSVASIRARYPRRSWVGYLPAVYSEDDRSRRSLERYLAVLQATADGIDRSIATIRRLFDPKAVPTGPFLEYLAGWIGVTLEEDWPDATKRRHLAAAPGLLRGRGTVKGLRDVLRVNLADAAGDAALAAYPGLPAIVEGFRLRRGLALGGAGRAELGRDAPGGPVRVSGGATIWGPAMVGRLVLGGYDRLGEGRLITEGSPDRDLYDAYAHKFRVVVPSAWVRDPSVARTIRRTIASEAPASAVGTLVTVGARLRVGVQSTIGLDAIVAAPAGARLGGPDDHALGRDAQLPPRSPRSDLRIDPGARVGVDTNLT